MVKMLRRCRVAPIATPSTRPSRKGPYSNPGAGARCHKRNIASAVILSASLLTACATPPEPKLQIREVQVPVSIKCASDPGPIPNFSDTPEALKAAADIFQKVALLLAGRAQRDAEIVVLNANVAGCR